MEWTKQQVALKRKFAAMTQDKILEFVEDWHNLRMLRDVVAVSIYEVLDRSPQSFVVDDASWNRLHAIVKAVSEAYYNHAEYWGDLVHSIAEPDYGDKEDVSIYNRSVARTLRNGTRSWAKKHVYDLILLLFQKTKTPEDRLSLLKEIAEIVC